MKAIYILKAGTTYPAIKKKFSDFDTWVNLLIGCPTLPVKIIDIEHSIAFPDPSDCAGIIITGSHDMVTDNRDWSVQAENQLASFLRITVPVLGICFGHQLLARAAGGSVGFHPGGTEVGTVSVALLPSAAKDPLFSGLPSEFEANVFHQQTVQFLPQQAVRLAANSFEETHAFRIGSCAWGVQFHPEFNADIMKAYIHEEARDLVFQGLNPPHLIDGVRDTPVSASIVQRFAGFCH
ncbi:MAG: glutamine amidotransferase [Spirochaetales bacterium]|nr:glutamine amidotransferase [Spirochaetales bacterium]